MEYCNGGSLAAVLEKPENMFGLQESEFLLVLKHLTDGMKILHQNKITHRDIKPNNILLQVLPNGKHVYKLTDFGAAKQMSKEDETFESIVGTEEYLFPDVYERAFYRVDNPNSAKADIDLWSIGVTLYHVSTGQLPFRPYGGRQARDVMIKITKDKKSGMISGIQHIESGPIEYDDKFPNTCQLSMNLQLQLIPMLAGLMENTFEQMWSFDKFFDYSSKITEKAYINILNVNKLQLFELSFEPNSLLINLKKEIEKETRIGLNSQLLIYNNLLLNTIINENTTRIITYPLMDNKNPLILFSLTTEIRAQITNIIKINIPYLNLRDTQKEDRTKPTHISEATFWSRNLVASFHQLKREIYQYSSILDLLKSSAITLKSFIFNNKLKQDNTIRQINSTLNVLDTKLMSFKKLFDFIKQLNTKTSQIQLQFYLNYELKEIKQEIDLYDKEIKQYEKRIDDLVYNEMLMRDTKIPSLKIHIDTICDNSQQLFDEYYLERREIRTQYNRDVPLKNSGLIRRTQMFNLKDDAKELHTQITQHFSDFFNTYQKWLNDLLKLNDLLIKIEDKLNILLEKLDTNKLQIDNDLNNKINLIIEFISIQQQQFKTTTNNLNDQIQSNNLASSSSSTTSTTTTTTASAAISSAKTNNKFIVNSTSSTSSTSTAAAIVTTASSSSAIISNQHQQHQQQQYQSNGGIGFEEFVKSISTPNDYLYQNNNNNNNNNYHNGQQQQQQQQIQKSNASDGSSASQFTSNGSNNTNNIGYPENEIANSIVSNYNHIYSLVYNLNAIKGENNETAKILNENGNLLK
jgi:serine/threonine protein kinase